MKIATVIVGTDADRFGRVGANPERLALASRIARFVKGEGSNLCVLPAGYLAATGGTTAAIRSTAEQLASVFAVDLSVSAIFEGDAGAVIDGSRSRSRALPGIAGSGIGNQRASA